MGDWRRERSRSRRRGRGNEPPRPADVPRAPHSPYDLGRGLALDSTVVVVAGIARASDSTDTPRVNAADPADS